MFCAKCEKNLLACECEDLAERVENLKTCKFLYLTPDQWKALEARGKLNKTKSVKPCKFPYPTPEQWKALDDLGINKAEQTVIDDLKERMRKIRHGHS